MEVGQQPAVSAEPWVKATFHASPNLGSSRAGSVYGGGRARDFAIGWIPHRGIHLESTPASRPGILTQYQQLTRPTRWQGGFLGGIHPASLRKLPAKEAIRESHRVQQISRGWAELVDSRLKNGLTFLAPLTYLLIIEE